MLAPLPSVVLRRATPAAALALALIASGCGGGDQKPLSQRTAAALIADLDQAAQRVESDNCNDARRGTLVRLKRKVEKLPEGTDGAIRTTVEDGVDHLETLIEAECERQAREREKRREEQQQEEEVPPTPTETIPPPVETTPEPPPETTPEPDPEPDEGGGGDDGGSGGDGGLPTPDPGAGGAKKPKSKGKG